MKEEKSLSLSCRRHYNLPQFEISHFDIFPDRASVMKPPGQPHAGLQRSGPAGKGTKIPRRKSTMFASMFLILGLGLSAEPTPNPHRILRKSPG